MSAIIAIHDRDGNFKRSIAISEGDVKKSMVSAEGTLRLSGILAGGPNCGDMFSSDYWPTMLRCQLIKCGVLTALQFMADSKVSIVITTDKNVEQINFY